MGNCKAVEKEFIVSLDKRAWCTSNCTSTAVYSNSTLTWVQFSCAVSSLGNKHKSGKWKKMCCIEGIFWPEPNPPFSVYSFRCSYTIHLFLFSCFFFYFSPFDFTCSLLFPLGLERVINSLPPCLCFFNHCLQHLVIYLSCYRDVLYIYMYGTSLSTHQFAHWSILSNLHFLAFSLMSSPPLSLFL